MDTLFVSETNPPSGRSAILSQESDSLWLYLTEKNQTMPVADCWCINLVEAPENLNDYNSKESGPPATKAFAGPNLTTALPQESDIRFLWSDDGESVAVCIKNEALAFIAAGQNRGHCKNLIQEGPFGKPFDEVLFGRIFGE